MFSTRIRRNRGRLACLECRRRKLRCDRNAPCTSCMRRGDAPSCSYEAAAGSLDHERDLRVQAEQRLEHLEQLVHQLAAQNGSNDGAPGSVASGSTASATRLNGINGGDHAVTAPIKGELEHSASIGASHWSAMLDDIHALRFAVSSSNTDDPGIEPASSGQETTSIALLFGAEASATMTIEEILSTYLPPRQEADRLVSSYFWRTSVAAPFIHSKQFRRQYQTFWTNPSGTPVLWISILFSILHVAANILTSGDRSFELTDQYTTAAARCLVLGEYFRPRRFAVEALLLYVQSYCLTSLELRSDVAPAFSVLIRLATRMGYHRDPETQNVSPFEKEMRRRTWSLCMQLDLLTSFHLGLPSSIQYPTWDTLPPNTLPDSAFDEDTVVMPTPTNTELTGMPFYIAKHHLMVVFEKLLRHALTVRPNRLLEDEVVSLDAELRRVYASLPQVIRRKPMSDCILEPPALIVTRLCVSFLYNKCLCVLHRLYVTKGREDSVRECYAAASTMVQDFLDAQRECLPGGILEAEQWFMTSITWHDFLLGVTSLCMVVCACSQGLNSPCTDRSAMLVLLERARLACRERAGGVNKDTARVLAVINATIRQFGRDMQDAERAPDATVNGQVQPISGAEDATNSFEMDWPWTENMTGTFDDPNWSYLDRFLGLPNQDDI